VSCDIQQIVIGAEMKACGGLKNLHMTIMNRFCKFFKNKTVNCHMQGAPEKAGYPRQKFSLPGFHGKLSKCYKVLIQAK
jgi:hypothetical protein